MMKRLAIIAAVLCIGVVSHVLHAAQQSTVLSPSATQPMGRVRGTVMDFSEAVIPGAIVIFKSEQVKKKVTSNESGNYEIELPVGTYEVTTELTNFAPFQRASFRVQPGTTTINVVPVPLAVSYGTVAPSYEYATFSLPSSSGVPLNLVIRFNTQQKRKGIIEYGKAMASYNVSAIYADKLRLDTQTFRLEAKGNVAIEDGKQRIHAKSAEIKFKAGEPVIKLTK